MSEGIEMVNTAKLKARMSELNLTQVQLAEKLHLSARTVSKKITGESPFTVAEAKVVIKELKIPTNELNSYFFV